MTSLRSKFWISIITGVLIVLAFVAKTQDAPGLVSAFFVVAAILAGVPTVLAASRALQVRAFSIDLLVSIAVIGALIIGEYEEAAIVAFLFIFGAYLEARTLEKTRRSLRTLIDSAPKEAEVIRGDETMTIEVDDVVVGDRIILRTGSQVPVDGTVVFGRGSINEAAVTGEPLPVSKDLDSQVWSGTVIDGGYLEMTADRVGEDTTFNKIIELVEEAQDSKAPTQKFLDRFASVYTPGIIVAAIIAGIITRDVEFALTLLVIACPGALVISTPVSLVAGLGNASRHGALLKGGDALENLAKIDTLVMDKTGTITRGTPEVTSVVPLGHATVEGILRLAGVVEKASEHPLGRTIVAAAAEMTNIDGTATDVEVIKGVGIEGVVDGHHVVVGSERAVSDMPADVAQRAVEQERGGNTVSFVVVDGQLHGMIAIADAVRPEVADAISALRRNGIKKFVMLTGDNEHTARAVADEVGVDEVEAQLLPHDKVAAVRELVESGHKVAMIGDGVNDAPAIATANLGIAMGAGTDVSMETADVILVGNRFDQLVHAFGIAKMTTANMRQNTVIALGTVALLILGVLLRVVGMGSGMLVHQASVLLVILNAARLIGFTSKDAKAIAGRHRETFAAPATSRDVRVG
ncbi:MAG: cation-translocating P-type ATPase [Trueperella sp.]|nr:cation-translocating P-type ATPase [Trueperella sp.]